MQNSNTNNILVPRLKNTDLLHPNIDKEEGQCTIINH